MESSSQQQPQSGAPAPSPVADDALMAGFASALAELSAMKVRITAVQQELRALQKLVVRERRAALRGQRKRPTKAGRPPSGFAKPTNVSAELAAFLGLAPDAAIARTEVTQRLIKYVSDNALQDPDKRQRIKPDKALSELLGIGAGDSLTYFNIQGYMNKHFPSSAES